MHNTRKCLSGGCTNHHGFHASNYDGKNPMMLVEGSLPGIVDLAVGRVVHNVAVMDSSVFVSNFYSMCLGKEYPPWPKPIFWWKVVS